MDKLWVQERARQAAGNVNRMHDDISRKIMKSDIFTDLPKKMLIEALKSCHIDPSYSADFCSMKLAGYASKVDSMDYERYTMIRDFLINTCDFYSYLREISRARGGFDIYLDSDPVEFDGDILITDPCYIMRAKHHGTIPLTDDDWATCDCGRDMGALGINHFMTRDTIYGDWGCSVYDTNTIEKIGEFSADAGLVSVFLLDEVLAYNPQFDHHITKPWCAAVIRDFKGTVQFTVEREEGVWEDSTDWHNAGETWEDFSVHVVGHGINKKTGAPIDFYTSQTSL